MDTPIRVLMVTSGWPQPGRPQTTHFIKRQATFLQNAGVDLEVFVFRGHKRVLNYIRGWFQVRAKLRSGRYDLVHAQFGQSAFLAVPKRIPLVVTFRGSDIQGLVEENGRQSLRSILLKKFCQVIARYADAVITVSAHMKAFIHPSVDVVVVPSGLDLDQFRLIPRDEARRHLGLALDKRYVLFAGNPDVRRKRYDLARAAVDALPAALGAELVVAWGVAHADIPYLMNACDALIFTSAQEGSPNVVKEALACNLPVVSVPVGDVPTRLAAIDGCEVVEDERAGPLAAALQRVLERGGRVDSRRTVECLDEHRTTAQVIELYGAVLRRAGVRPPVTTRPEPVAAPSAS